MHEPLKRIYITSNQKHLLIFFARLISKAKFKFSAAKTAFRFVPSDGSLIKRKAFNWFRWLSFLLVFISSRVNGAVRSKEQKWIKDSTKTVPGLADKLDEP